MNTVHEAVELPQNKPLFAEDRNSEDVAYAATSQAVAFSDCAGILHPARGALAVIMAGSFGYEAMASQKAFRILAEQLAAAGFPSLRFDYPGTGDSIGDETTRNLIESRREAIISASRFMRALPGIEGIALLGFRLGASVAAKAASECEASHLVLVEPAVTGRSWLREQELLPRLAGIPTAVHASTDSNREYMGYTMSEASHTAIRAFDLRKVSLHGVRHCLILSDTSPRTLSDCVAHWRSEDVCVEQEEFHDFSILMSDPALSSTPAGLFRSILPWLGQPPLSDLPFRTEVEDAVLGGDVFVERAVYFGGDVRRYGVLCEPLASNVTRPVVVLPNTGGNPHSGWGRQTVDLARHLARLGVASFRIDVNGIGETADIPGRPNRLVYVPSSREDVVAAIDYLGQKHYLNVAVVGICSGAYLAYQASLCDPRIRAIQLINLQKFEWGEDDELVLHRSLTSYFSMLREPETWRRISRAEIDLVGISVHIARKLLGKLKARARRVLSSAGLLNRPSIPTPLERLQRHLDGGMRISIAYTEGDGGADEAEIYLGRKGRYLSDYEQFIWESVPASGHNFESIADRAKLCAIVGQFAKRLTLLPDNSR